MLKYKHHTYKIIKLGELESLDDYIHYDIKHTASDLCAIASALELGIISEAAMDDIAYFCPASDWNFSEQQLKSMTELAIIRQNT